MSPDENKRWSATPDDHEHRRFGRSLVFRIAVLLSVALLPIGLVALVQSWRALDAANDNLEASLHARTSVLIEQEQRELLTKRGVARGLADALGAIDLDPARCSDIMRRISINENVAFVGVVEQGSRSICNSAGQSIEFPEGERAQTLFANPEPFIGFSARGFVSQTPVTIISHPIFDAEDGFRGFLTLSFAAQPLEQTQERVEAAGDVALAMFNKYGEILSQFTPEGEIESYLPGDLALDGFVNRDGSFFTATSLGGQRRLISVVPILPGEVYALSSWGRDTLRELSSPWFAGTTLLFPFLMWAVGIVVAVISLNRLVLRHINDLNRRMRAFAARRTMKTSQNIDEAPSELQTINETFEGMAAQLLRDEADLQNAIFEREVLLKEVYHRVKNNLQLISSIINMQVRQVSSPEGVAALRQFQDRVNSLASVHRALYQEPSLTKLRVDVLIGDLVQQIANIGAGSKSAVRIAKKLDPVTLAPDHASPLAMAATEMLSNVFKYGAPGQDGVFRLDVGLRMLDLEGADHVRLSIRNSTDPSEPTAEGTGLGKRLIAAFSSQLEAKIAETVGDDWYEVSITFPYQPFKPEDV
ncbi:sensor histidine kinase [Marivita sp. GX14005]|uniref:sensor histidine kinase n=1 Tax=Marivita sp. GX14005 TaxID=2942276 RepID=UPI002019393E|nr:sensor histidine kinase [Marivita sp. GX14005]MCL3881556.1 sensor histidine kinase [Marivita sp. GX14005]